MTEATRDENGTWRAISVGRALDVLNAFMGEDATLSMSELARLNDLPTTTMHRLVLQLTDVSRPGDGNRAVRKAKDRDHLSQASPEAQTVKLADLLDNADSILRYDRAFSKVFLREMAELLEVMTGGDPELRRQARACLESR